MSTILAQPAKAGVKSRPSKSRSAVVKPQPTEPAVSPLKRRFVIGISVICFLVLAVQLMVSSLLSGRIMPGVTVSGLNLGGLTRPDAREILAAHLKGRVVDIKVGAAAYRVTPPEVGAAYDVDETLDNALSSGRSHPVSWSLATKRSTTLSYVYHVDTKTQQAFVDRVVAASGQLPVDAAIVIDKGKPTVAPDQKGLALSSEDVSHAIDQQLKATHNQTVSLTPTVQTARITASDTTPALAATQELLAIPVTITYQGRTFQPTVIDKGNWIAFDKTAAPEAPGLTPKVNPDGIRTYLQKIAKQINVSPITQKVNVQNGISQVFQEGKDGTQLDADSLAGVIASGVSAKQPVAAEAPTKTVSFQTQYNNSVAQPFDRYIEINLSQQHLWVYENHVVVFDTAITSGATGAGFPTATGTFSILAKQTNRHLVGYQYGPQYNYDVFVKYWMPFYQGYGLHDASWRNGKFGGQDYYYGGSHGCVNLPDAAAAWIYNWATVGTAVWVH